MLKTPHTTRHDTTRHGTTRHDTTLIPRHIYHPHAQAEGKKTEAEDGDEPKLPVPAVLTTDQVTSSPTEGNVPARNVVYGRGGIKGKASPCTHTNCKSACAYTYTCTYVRVHTHREEELVPRRDLHLPGSCGGHGCADGRRGGSRVHSALHARAYVCIDAGIRPRSHY